MTRKYAALWKRLAANETVTIVCPRRGIKPISASIYNEKYRHQVARKATDLPGYGRIDIKQEDVEGKPNHVRLIITVRFSGDNL